MLAKKRYMLDNVTNYAGTASLQVDEDDSLHKQFCALYARSSERRRFATDEAVVVHSVKRRETSSWRTDVYSLKRRTM